MDLEDYIGPILVAFAVVLSLFLVGWGIESAGSKRRQQYENCLTKLTEVQCERIHGGRQ